jgi:hypothetical protein
LLTITSVMRSLMISSIKNVNFEVRPEAVPGPRCFRLTAPYQRVTFRSSDNLGLKEVSLKMTDITGFSSKASLMTLVVLCMVLTAGCIARPSPESLIIQKTAYYKTGAKAGDKIRDECGLEQVVPTNIKAYARGNYDSIFFSDTLSDSTPAKVLVMKIANAQGLGGGRYSGPKSLTVEGTLRQDGKVLGSFIVHRATMGGYGGGTKGTCSLLHRCAKRIGKDVGVWLENPTMIAVLGTAKSNGNTSEPEKDDDEEK